MGRRGDPCRWRMGHGQGAWPAVQGEGDRVRHAAFRGWHRALSGVGPDQGHRAEVCQADCRQVWRGDGGDTGPSFGASQRGAWHRNLASFPHQEELGGRARIARGDDLHAGLRDISGQDRQDLPAVWARLDRHHQVRSLPALPRHLGHRLRHRRQDRHVGGDGEGRAGARAGGDSAHAPDGGGRCRTLLDRGAGAAAPCAGARRHLRGEVRRGAEGGGDGGADRRGAF